MGSLPDEVLNFLNIPNPRAKLSTGIYWACNRNDYQKQKNKQYLGSRVRLVREVDNLMTICEPIIYEMWDVDHVTTL
jgi:hypothetical protein